MSQDWWSYASSTASSAWNTVQESAKDIASDFTTSFQEENEETIQQIKERVDSEKISDQFSTATQSINSFINTTLQSITTETTKSDTIKRVTPKFAKFVCDSHELFHSFCITNTRSFEKERSTYCSDPSTMSGHKEKFAKFIEDDLGLSDDDICLKGRCLLHTNSAIRTYYEQLVETEEMNEVTFWQRYFYAKYQAKLREILISKHSACNNDDDDENEEDEIELGVSGDISEEKENVDESEENDDGSEKEIELGDVDKNKVVSDDGVAEKLSEETSWTDIANSDEHKTDLYGKRNETSEDNTEKSMTEVEDMETKLNDNPCTDNENQNEIQKKVDEIEPTDKEQINEKNLDEQDDSDNLSLSDESLNEEIGLNKEEEDNDDSDWGDWGDSD